MDVDCNGTGGAYWRLKSDWGGCAMCVWVSVCTVLVWMDGWMDGHKPREAAASSVSMSDRREIRGGEGQGALVMADLGTHSGDFCVDTAAVL